MPYVSDLLTLEDVSSLLGCRQAYVLDLVARDELRCGLLVPGWKGHAFPGGDEARCNSYRSGVTDIADDGQRVYAISEEKSGKLVMKARETYVSQFWFMSHSDLYLPATTGKPAIHVRWLEPEDGKRLCRESPEYFPVADFMFWVYDEQGESTTIGWDRVRFRREDVETASGPGNRESAIVADGDVVSVGHRNTHLPSLASVAEACSWLSEHSGEKWTLPRILEAGGVPWIWLDYSQDAPKEVFGDRYEGFLAPFVFTSDTYRLSVDRKSALMTMTRLPDGRLARFSPGVLFDLGDVRFKREELLQLADVCKAALSCQNEGIEWKPAGAQRIQEQVVLETLQNLGYDPKKLQRPRPGTSGPKAEVRKAIGTSMTDSVFKKAWERLRAFGDIEDDS